MSNENKNVWVAISLSIITSFTSLGTALITQRGNDVVTEIESLKNFKKTIEKEIKDLKNKFTSEEKLSLTYKGIIKKQTNSLQKKIILLEKEIKSLKEKK